MKKMRLSEDHYIHNTPRWRLGRALAWVAMFVIKVELWVLPVPKGTMVEVHYILPPGSVGK